MSSLKSVSNFKFDSLGTAMFFVAVAVMATAAFGGTINHGSYAAGTVTFRDVTESGPDIPPGLFVPPAPVPSYTAPTNELAFFPTDFILTDQSLAFDLKSKSSQIGMFATTVPDPTAAITAVNLNIAGLYDVYAPFASVPPSGATSVAQVQMSNVPLTIKVTGVNGSPYAIGSPLTATMPVAPNEVTVVGPGGAAAGTWSGSFAANMAALRAAAGLLPTDRITELQIQANPAIHAASVYATARAQVTNYNVQVNAVPEPPTMVLAGLGVAATVGHSLRRRMMRRNAEAGSEMVGGNFGAVALTA